MSDEINEVMGAALIAARTVLYSSSHSVQGIVLMAELDNTGITVACEDVDVWTLYRSGRSLHARSGG